MNHRSSLRVFAYSVMFCILPVAGGATYGAALTASSRAAENAELQKAKNHFNSAEFDKAIAILDKLVSTSTLSQTDRIEALEYLAYCHVARQNDESAKTCFMAILRMRPDYEPAEAFMSDPGLMRCYLAARKKEVGNLWQAGHQAGVKTIAVLDFDNNSIDDVEKLANLGKGLADMIITDLATLSKLKVVERERIQFVLDELALGDSTIKNKRLVDPEFAVRVGKLMGAQSVLIGSFMKFGKKLRVDVRMVKTETSEIFKTDFVDGSQDDIFDLSKKLAIKVTQNLDVALDKLEKEKLENKEVKEVPLEAMMAYSEALNLLDQERYTEARTLLDRALTIAPDFQMAQQKLDVLKTFSRG